MVRRVRGALVTDRLAGNVVGYGNSGGGAAFGIFTFMLATCCITPTLGAILFTLSLDVARARKHVARLAEGARNQTLTVEQYRQASEAIRVIVGSWQLSIWVLAGVAFYSTVGMVVYLGSYSELSILNDLYYMSRSWARRPRCYFCSRPWCGS